MTKPWEQSEQEQAAPPDHYVVQTGYQEFAIVSPETARTIEAELDREPVPRWISFCEVHGNRMRVRSRAIWCIQESTAEQRARFRVLKRAMKAEQKADGWED